MITVDEARGKLKTNCEPLCDLTIKLHSALGMYLAHDLQSPIDHPCFDQTAVDGYALNLNQGYTPNKTYSIIGEIKAGDAGNIEIKEGEAIRIFTGASVPKSADSVVMQEHIIKEGNQIKIQKEGILKGANIRLKGEQLTKGSTALKKGTLLTAAGIGFLASLGIQQVSVYQKPLVGIVVTGNEFAEGVNELEEGKIFESNGQMLVSALHKIGINTCYQTCIDDIVSLEEMLIEKEKAADVLLITGGVSVGDYDFTIPVLEKMGFKTIFHKIKQKPGKPLYFGKKGNKVAFGLPGNPRSVMVCFYQYVYSYLNQLMGSNFPDLKSILLPLANDYKRKADGKVHFLSASIVNNEANLLNKQASHMLQSLALADGFVISKEDNLFLKKGEPVNFHLIP